jgi:hypothetical protein
MANKPRKGTFQYWLGNDYPHLLADIKTNKRLIALAIGMMAAIFVRVFIGG